MDYRLFAELVLKKHLEFALALARNRRVSGSSFLVEDDYFVSSFAVAGLNLVNPVQYLVAHCTVGGRQVPLRYYVHRSSIIFASESLQELIDRTDVSLVEVAELLNSCSVVPLRVVGDLIVFTDG